MLWVFLVPHLQGHGPHEHARGTAGEPPGTPPLCIPSPAYPQGAEEDGCPQVECPLLLCVHLLVLHIHMLLKYLLGYGVHIQSDGAYTMEQS